MHELDAKRLERQGQERERKEIATMDGAIIPRRANTWRRPSWRDQITLSNLPDYDKEKRARCGATARGTGLPCRLPVVAFRDRCKWHKGCSTGRKTKERKEAIAEAQRRRWAWYGEAKQAVQEPVC